MQWSWSPSQREGLSGKIPFKGFAMKRIIDRTLYDTDQTEQLAKYETPLGRGDYDYVAEALYKTADGEYFLHAEGGAGTKWAKKTGNYHSFGKTIERLTPEDAVDWCEDREIDGGIVIEEFTDLINC